MACMDQIQDAPWQDPEKREVFSPKAPSVENGDSKDVKSIHADPNDGDEALKAFEGGETIAMTEVMERNLLRKIDLNLMPVGFSLSGMIVWYIMLTLVW